MRTVYPDYGRGVLPEEQLNDVAQKIARMLPRRQRRAFEQAALSFRDGGMFEAERWRAGCCTRGTARRWSRPGTCWARSSRSCARTAIWPARASRGGDELLNAARDNAEVVEMINFAVSDELAALNRRLGVD